jgi:hypothetical protein
MKKITISCVLFLILSSCATHHGMISSSSVNGNFVYEDFAYGVAQTKIVFGFGGLSQDALVLEAKRELMKNRPLEANEEYLNFTVDFKRSFWPFTSQNKVTMSADVIRHTEDSNADPYSENYLNKLSRLNLSNELFNVGDSVLFKKDKKGIIISMMDNDKVRIQYINKQDNIRTKSLSIYDIYTINKSYKNYSIDGHYTFPVRRKGGENVEMGGVIIGIGLKSLLVKDTQDDIQIVRIQP